MGRSRRVGGSGWAGVAGSFIGLSGKRVWGKGKKQKLGKASSSQQKRSGFRGVATWEKARSVGLTPDQWKERCDRDVREIEKEYAELKAKVNELKAELLLAEKARRSAYELNSGPDSSDS